MTHAARIEIRPERPADQSAITRVLRAAFPTALEARLVDSLREEDSLIESLVAIHAGEVVGHVVFSLAGVIGETATAKVAWLAPLAVLPEHQGQGIGSALVEAGIEGCRRRSLDGVVVVGAPAYYGRFGFSLAAARDLQSRFAGPALMALPLGAPFAGSLTELPAFSSLA